MFSANNKTDFCHGTKDRCELDTKTITKISGGCNNETPEHLTSTSVTNDNSLRKIWEAAKGSRNLFQL